MNVRVLGSCGPKVTRHQTRCLLINQNVAVDAGGITAKLSVEEQTAIDHVLISHAQMDHVYDLTFLADNTMAEEQSLCVYGPR